MISEDVLRQGGIVGSLVFIPIVALLFRWMLEPRYRLPNTDDVRRYKGSDEDFGQLRRFSVRGFADGVAWTALFYTVTLIAGLLKGKGVTIIGEAKLQGSVWALALLGYNVAVIGFAWWIHRNMEASARANQTPVPSWQSLLSLAGVALMSWAPIIWFLCANVSSVAKP